MKHILIITAGLGNGHNTAAKGIYSQKKSVENHIETIDITKTTIMGKIMKWFFFHLPEKYLEKIFFDTNTQAPKALERFFYKTLFPSLSQKIQKTEYDEIIFTFPCFSLLVPHNFPGKISIHVTDYISPHLSWIWGNFKEIHVLDTESQKYLSQYIPQKKIHVSPFPLSKKIQEKISIKDRNENRNNRISLFFHNILLGNELAMIEKIRKKFPSHTLNILGGRNFRFFKNEPSLQQPNINIFPWIDDIENIYHQSDIVGGKCGGAFISEVMARNIPVIITGVFSGQEKGNFKYLQKYYTENLIQI